MTEVNYPHHHHHHHHMFNWNLIEKLSPKIKPPMSTPDDPVIHNSPPSLHGISQQGSQQQLQQGGYCGSISQSESRTPSCDSPGAEGSAEERSRRSKLCRVCGDHATGYNFNVITCESCKAFFRRNALRPKEFKCPYSEDCEINAVSRRFCQKCRLRKCFDVGMKKEWILNEEQLRRRKNSRLNNLTSPRLNSNPSTQQAAQSQSPRQKLGLAHQTAQIIQAPLISPKGINIGTQEQFQFGNNSNRLELTPPMISPSANQNSYSITPPIGLSASTPSSSSMPPITPPSTIPTPINTPINDYEPNLLLHQRFSQQQRSQCVVSQGVSQSQSYSSQSPIISSQSTTPLPTTRVNVDPVRNQVTMSVDEYNQLIQMASNRPSGEIPTPPATIEEPPLKRSSLESGMLQQPGRPYSATITTQSLAEGNGGGYASYTDLNNGSMGRMGGMGGMFPEGFQEKMASFFDQTIIDALNVDSPDAPPQNVGGTRPASVDDYQTSDVRANYQLNIAELRELDMVRAAFTGMNDPLDDPKQKLTFMKDNKTPTDIMNIMDITMRRLVKMAKKLPVFNELSQDGKFMLLKGGMVEMLTVRGVTRYDEKAGCWHTPTLPAQYQVPIKMFDNLKEGVREVQKERFLQFFRTLNDDLRRNELAIDLLMLTVLFKPRAAVPEGPDRIMIERQHNDFMALLHRYLESLYGDESRRFHEMIPKALHMLEIISSNTAMLFMGKVNKDEAEPLPKEFFPVE